MDNKSKEKLSKVHPVLAQKVESVISKLAAQGLDVRVVQGLRTFAEQDSLYAQGRSKPGSRVTNAIGGFSNHNYGLAADLCPFTNDQPDWENTPAFLQIIKTAKSEGLESGGDWKFKDMPHVQLRGMSVKECQQAYRRGGLPKVWARMTEIIGGGVPVSFIPKADELLEFGDRGAEVQKLQNRLVELNLLRPHEADAQFGKITKNALIAFQRINNLTADGIAGQGTKAKLKI